jgi:hypothetical protein
VYVYLQEWVGVMSQDVSRQRRPQPTQQPFSDAYIAGMPHKRRRVSGAIVQQHGGGDGGYLTV